MFNIFKKKVDPLRNPWLDIPHPCNWLEANNGDELVCGDCSARKPNTKKGKANGKTKKSTN
jgi:hypothetical protein